MLIHHMRWAAMPIDIPATYGALLLGAFGGLSLSGVLSAQVVIYLKMYPDDGMILKRLVLVVWLLDFLHSTFICATLWEYFIRDFGDPSAIAGIPSTLPITVVLTAILTFFVHWFYTYRIHRVSKGNWWISIPIAILVVARLCAACVTTATMLRLKNFHSFLYLFRWVFTLGLSLSSSVDILITGSLFYFLGMGRTISSALDAVIDSLLLYAFESGALTCAATIISTVFWLVMPQKLIFMGFHFVIGKLYANSLLLTLNTRKHIRRISVSGSTRQNIVLALPRDPGNPKPRSSLSHAGRFPPSRELSVRTAESSRGVDGAPIQDSPQAQLRFSVNTARTDYRWDGERDVHTPPSVRSAVEIVRPLDAFHSLKSEDGRSVRSHLLSAIDFGSRGPRQSGDMDIEDEDVSEPIFPSLSKRPSHFTWSPRPLPS